MSASAASESPTSVSYARQACLSCHGQKRKCGRQLPRCNLCEKKGRRCEYPLKVLRDSEAESAATEEVSLAGFPLWRTGDDITVLNGHSSKALPRTAFQPSSFSTRGCSATVAWLCRRLKPICRDISRPCSPGRRERSSRVCWTGILPWFTRRFRFVGPPLPLYCLTSVVVQNHTRLTWPLHSVQAQNAPLSGLAKDKQYSA
jgi:hypothetical protein